MSGSMRARPDRGPSTWELRVYVGRDSTGRVRHRSHLFRGTRRAAEKELARMIVKQEDVPETVPDEASRPWGPTTTFNDAIAGWRDNGWQDLSPLTAQRYEGVWRLYIRDTLGRRRIESVGPYDIERFFRKLKADGAGRETIRYARSVLHRACRLARKWSGNTLTNPVADTELPVFTRAELPESVRAPTLDEVLAILGAAESLDIRYRAGLVVVAATGMRRGEACGLRWSGLDVEGATLSVDESVIAAPEGAVSKAPKTRASVRRVAIDTGTLGVLQELYAAQAELARLADVRLEEAAFILSMEPGGKVPLHPDTLSKAFAKARKTCGVASELHLHSLRHFQATAIDAVISERQKQSRLGWSTAHMARHYTDSVGEEDRRAAEHVGRLLAGKGAPQAEQ
jgi:integrase